MIVFNESKSHITVARSHSHIHPKTHRNPADRAVLSHTKDATLAVLASVADFLDEHVRRLWSWLAAC
jgi:hypothetical protein